ncbi:MAG: UDP-N-acetylmuramate--L-alanine ligase [Defluviitaleaceae bacterium]|nr:UDP-N-acetylmuramate--L-alanine ligase [Defluviitaleaceae bacterium]
MDKLKIIDGCTNFHFVGIGGINMSALAEVLFREGYTVGGSDKSDSPAVDKLRGLGLNVAIGHCADNLSKAAEVLVYNAAVPTDNPEVAEARNRGLKLLDRAQLLGLLMQNYKYPICVAGTHGKTTTTSMLAEIFTAADADPTVMSGGILPSMGGAMRLGGRKFFIAEACEYHDSFLHFSPYVGIILNLEMDHGDYFGGEAGLRASFRNFAKRIPAHGLLIINNEIAGLDEIVGGLDCEIITFGEGGDIFASNAEFGVDGRSVCQIEGVGQLSLGVPGAHNISNALSAIAVARHFGLPFVKAAQALSGFTGALRRFQHKGQFNGAIIIDDYAHHPTEVSATIQAARNMAHNRLWIIFQPHTHERTAKFLYDFANALHAADNVIITDIYRPAGREQEQASVHAKDLVAKIGSNCHYAPNFQWAADFVRNNLVKGDICITMGAGDITRIGDMILLDSCNFV